MGLGSLRSLRRMFGLNMDEVTGEWRKLHNEELSETYSSLYIARVIKLRKMRWAGYLACMGVEDRRIQGFGEKA